MSTHTLAAALPAPVVRGGTNPRRWTGRALSGFAALFLLFDGVIKLMVIPEVTTSMIQLGYPVHLARPLGALLLACLVVYLIQRTAILGAVLLTGYLGGAIASQLRVEAPLLGFTLFPIYVAILLWGGLYLRDPRLHTLLSSRSDR